MKKPLSYPLVELLDVLNHLKNTKDIEAIAELNINSLFICSSNPFVEVAPDTYTARVEDYSLTIALVRTDVGYMYNLQLSFGSNVLVNNSTTWAVFVSNTYELFLKALKETHCLTMWENMLNTINQQDELEF